MSNTSSEPDPSGLDPAQLEALEAVAATLSPAQTLFAARWLLSRFDTSALLEERFEIGAEAEAAAPLGLTVLYGSHSGHSAAIAKNLAQRAREKGWAVTLANMADYARSNLKHEKNLAVVVSTHGEGDPPESIVPFFDYLQGKRAPALSDCAFAVLALGDRSYVHFCKTGADIDARLEKLGGTRTLSRVDLDVDYQDGADAWTDAALEAFAPRMVKGISVSHKKPPASRKHAFDRENPWSAELLERAVLSGRGSTQFYAHLELSLEGSRIKYEPGDALGVRPENDPELVAGLVEALQAPADAEVSVAGEALTLADALTRRFEVRLPTPSALRKYAAHGARELTDIAADPAKVAAYLEGRDWLDILREHPTGIAPESFLALLPALTSRSYSIASCQASHPDEVHLLVSRLTYNAHGRKRLGVASGYLGDRVQQGDKLAVWIEPNSVFRLPANSDVPIVLIGAGTGVAPYRAFLQHRSESGAKGKNWVIFGNRNFRSDFTYQTEWLKWRSQGVLTRMDVAFSRDTARKLYVTDKIREVGSELYAWIEAGAHVYLCGDRAKLSASVDQAILDVLVKCGDKSPTQAAEYLAKLQADRRYVKDVY